MGLMMDSSGNLYGTTGAGVASVNCCGTVFELVNSSGNYTEKILYSFTDAWSPNGALILDATGKFYGTTTVGNGAVFELTNSSGSYVAYVLHAFMGYPSDGAAPDNLITDSVGNLYGITYAGGLNGGGFSGFGTVFEIPNASALSVIFTPNALNFGGRLGTPATTQSITVNNIGADWPHLWKQRRDTFRRKPRGLRDPLRWLQLYSRHPRQ